MFWSTISRRKALISLALLAGQTVGIVGLGLWQRKQIGKTESGPEAIKPDQLDPQLQPIAKAMRDVAESASLVVQLRDLNHWLNSKQWYFAHEHKASTEIEAITSLMNAMVVLKTELNSPLYGVIEEVVNGYCMNIEKFALVEDGDTLECTAIREEIMRQYQLALEQIAETWSNVNGQA